MTPSVLIEPAYAAAREDAGAATFQVRLSQACDRAVAVPYTLSGTAARGGDCGAPAPASPLVFVPGDVVRTVHVPLVDDAEAEPDECVTVVLGSPSNAVLSRSAVHRLAIRDNDGPPPAPEAWSDAFFPFRAPIRVEVPAPGEYNLAVTPEMVTAWMNEQADFRFASTYFNYDGLALVEVDAEGRVADDRVQAGYFLRTGEELLANGGFEQNAAGRPDGWIVSHESFRLARTSFDGSWCMTAEGADRNWCGQTAPTQTNTWYRFSYWAEGSASAEPMIDSATLGMGLQPIAHDYADPYLPARGWRFAEFFFHVGDKADWVGETLWVRMERITGSVDRVSLRECDVRLVLNAESGGTKRYLLYYSPLEGTTTRAPGRSRTEPFPSVTLAVERSGPAEWLRAGVAHGLRSEPAADLWYASPVHKVLPREAPPPVSSDRIALSCARNESEALQIVLTPRSGGEVTSVSAGLTDPGGAALDPSSFDVRIARYVTVRTASRTGLGFTTPSRSEFTGDLPDPLTAFRPTAFQAGGTNVPIWVDIAVPAAARAGTYTGAVQVATTAGTWSVPLELTVRDFALPDRPSCRSAMQLSRYANAYLFPWHKVTTTEDKYALSRAYVAEMARYRLSETGPTTSALYHPDGPPAGPQGFYERELPWAMDELHLTGFTMGHVSGNSLAATTPEQALQVGAEYEPQSAYLAERGWLPLGYIQIDEPQPYAYPGVRTWIEGFRAYPHAKDISMFGFVYHGEAWERLRDHLDIFVPVNNDCGSQLSSVGAALVDPGKETWGYWTCTAHQWIDAPGIGHRLWAPKVRWCGGRGLSTWAILKWWSENGETYCDNPWVDLWTPWGNGMLAYFYPPHPAGLALPAKDMTVVPSLRLVLTRDGIEDFEYAAILENLIGNAEAAGLDPSAGVGAMADWIRPFATPQSWSLADSYWLETRARVGAAISDLARRAAPGSLLVVTQSASRGP